MRILFFLTLTLLSASSVRGQAQVGDLFIKVPPNINALCMHRPDGSTVACSQGLSTDWWITGTPTADLGWVTLALGPVGYDLLRFDHTGVLANRTWIPQLWNASEMRTMSDGRILIADPSINTLHFVTADGTYLSAWSLNGTFTPNRICVDPNDGVWAFDGNNGKARHYNSSGNLVGTFNTGLKTWDVALADDGSFWLFELGSPVLWNMSATGSILGSVNYVHGPVPVALEVDPDGSLWVAGWNSNWIDHISDQGALLGTFKALGPASHMQIIRPGGPIGSGYCGPANVNSTGQPGLISATGRAYAHLDQVRLEATQLPPNEFGMFITSQTQGFATPPGSQGNLCLGGAIGRFTAAAGSTGAAGRLQLDVDTNAIPTSPPAQIQPGQTWNFQAWFRDVNPGPTSNFTDAVSVTFL
jgi:hypothetical protein